MSLASLSSACALRPAAARALRAAGRPQQQQQRAFADASHLAYYSSPSTSGRPCAQAGSPAGKPSGSSRRMRVEAQAARVAATLERLAADQPLASYPLRLPARQRPRGSPSSSESSSDSEFEMRRRPSSATAVTSAPAAAPPRPQLPVLPTTTPEITMAVCQGKHCKKAGSDKVLMALQRVADGSAATVTGCKCLKQCERGPAVRVSSPEGRAVIYTGVGSSKALARLASAVLHDF